jgi:hypothetical protein
MWRDNTGGWEENRRGAGKIRVDIFFEGIC